ncbi:transporter substrate-binding protein [Tateyamaria sp. Alg231-49]|uniref:transporter substrate-binding protein n=1 Tax=Tateyamaria sp. Alg231-49 TaxID=1922219 RepID=UPI001F217B3A|nr:transporter substrate-binding protein [Tateyamaria sp. Alg231-49]
MGHKNSAVRIGLLYSNTGVTSVVETHQRNAALLAIEEINQSGGLLGQELLFSGEDTCSNPVAFRAEAERLILEDKCPSSGFLEPMAA